MARLTGRTVAFLTSSKGIEEPELTTPWQAVADEGGTPVLVSAAAGTVRAVNNDLDPGGEYPVDRTLDQVSADEIDALVIPGGTVNADTLRTQEGAQALVKDQEKRKKKKKHEKRIKTEYKKKRKIKKRKKV